VVDATLPPEDIAAIVIERVQAMPALRRDVLSPPVPLGRPDAEPTPPPVVATDPLGGPERLGVQDQGNGLGQAQPAPNPTAARSNVDVQ
jgi:hypothetical protein